MQQKHSEEKCDIDLGVSDEVELHSRVHEENQVEHTLDAENEVRSID